MTDLFSTTNWHLSDQGGPSAAIVINADKGALFEGLARNLESHLRAHVVICEDVDEAAAPDHFVQLLLVHVRPGEIPSTRIEQSQQIFPEAALALLVDRADGEGDWRGFADAASIQGFIPLTLKLEVFLAAVSLVLSGGQFFPVARSRPLRFAKDLLQTRLGSGVGTPVGRTSAAAASTGRAGEFAHLTTRERQVLSLIAEGWPNKLIADRVKLSEHTVKVHVHNLMNKLNVTNRTQAAAVFHSLAPEPRGSARRNAAQ
jgi:DNA-binding NarL/FixJ family response regulator